MGIWKWVGKGAAACALQVASILDAVSSISSVRVPCSVGVVLGVLSVQWVEITAAREFGRL